jgi:hypothetical protein
MKTLNKKHKVFTIIMILVCMSVFTSCWDNLNGRALKADEEAPAIRLNASSSISYNTITIHWTEPNVSTYTGMTVSCTNITTPPIQSKGTTSYIFSSGISPSTEYTITLTAHYSTGYNIESLSFKLTTLPSGASAQTIYLIYTSAELAVIYPGHDYDYCILMNDLDLSEYSSGEGWPPFTSFHGTFDGQNYTIRNLTVHSSTSYKGLFGKTNIASTIKNLNLRSINISGTSYVGGLVGDGNGSIINCTSSGSVSGTMDNIGGLVGSSSGTMTNCSSSCTVTGRNNVGGLVGDNASAISYCRASGTVSGTDFIGGLVGFSGSSISFSYASGNVSGHDYIGGLLGYNDNSCIVGNCYATGNVTGTGDNIGGLLGYSQAGNESYCYAIGHVYYDVASSNVGGLIGSGGNHISCYYNTTTTGQSGNVLGITGLSDSVMKNPASYLGWGIPSATWGHNATKNNGYPYLIGLEP